MGEIVDGQATLLEFIVETVSQQAHLTDEAKCMVYRILADFKVESSDVDIGSESTPHSVPRSVDGVPCFSLADGGRPHSMPPHRSVVEKLDNIVVDVDRSTGRRITPPHRYSESPAIRFLIADRSHLYSSKRAVEDPHYLFRCISNQNPLLSPDSQMDEYFLFDDARDNPHLDPDGTRAKAHVEYRAQIIKEILRAIRHEVDEVKGKRKDRGVRNVHRFNALLVTLIAQLYMLVARHIVGALETGNNDHGQLCSFLSCLCVDSYIMQTRLFAILDPHQVANVLLAKGGAGNGFGGGSGDGSSRRGPHNSSGGGSTLGSVSTSAGGSTLGSVSTSAGSQNCGGSYAGSLAA